MRHNFHFAGFVPFATLPAWYDRFSVFVAPVWQESFGQVTPFAMSKRLAVAGYRVGALPEILQSEETLCGEREELVELLIRLLDDPAHLQRLGKKNHEIARANFDVAVMSSKYAILYDRMLRGEATSVSA